MRGRSWSPITLAVLLLLASACGDDATTATTSSRGAPPRSSEVSAWPPVAVDDGVATLSFVLLDGTEGTLSLPTAVMGTNPRSVSVSVAVGCVPDCGSTEVQAVRPGSDPFAERLTLTRRLGPDGSFAYYGESEPGRLVWTVDDWLLTTPTALIPTGDLDAWARDLRTEVRDDGWLELTVAGPLEVGLPGRDQAGLDLDLGDTFVSALTTTCTSTDTTPATPSRDTDAWAATVCLDDRLLVNIAGTEATVQVASAGIEGAVDSAAG